MKKITLILLSLVLITAMVSCKKEEQKEIDLTDPTLSISDCIEVPYQYDLSEYIEIDKEDYMGIEVEKTTAEVTTEDVNYAVQEDLEANASYNDVDRGAQVGDFLNIDFKGIMDGIQFDGGQAEGYELQLGYGGLIEGFEDAIVGHSAGEEFTIDVIFPEDYTVEERAGKDAQFEIKINSVKEQILPALTDEFVKEKFDSETVLEYLEVIKEELAAEKALEADTQLKSNALGVIYENIKILSYPQDEFKFYYDDCINFYEELAKTQYNMSLTDFLSTYGMTEEELVEYANYNAAYSVEEELILFSIANSEQLWQDLTKGDYDDYLKKMAGYNDATPEEYEAYYGSDIIWKQLVGERAIAFVLNNAILVESTETETTSD